ncbi:MAG: hypothetical protein J6F30_05090 [Cellulosilyticum sp.]|nr:hypothetical protein [Cellulosilyticum sp.]
MNIDQLILKYQQKNRHDMRSVSVDDLLEIHGVDYKKVKGFNTLSEENKSLFKSFIVQFYNAQGMRGKLTLVPENIAYVNERYWGSTVLNADGTSSWNIIKEEHRTIDTEGNELSVIFSKLNEKHDSTVTNIIERQNYYIRFDYKIYDRPAWLHIEQDISWW